MDKEIDGQWLINELTKVQSNLKKQYKISEIKLNNVIAILEQKEYGFKCSKMEKIEMRLDKLESKLLPKHK